MAKSHRIRSKAAAGLADEGEIVMLLYRVSHTRPHPDHDDVELWLHIGFYSKRGLAENAVTRLKGQPGFREHPNSFSIDQTPLNVTHWPEGFETVTGPG